MPKQTPSASDFTSVVRSAAVANNIASLPSGSLLAARATASAASVSRTPLSAVSSIVKQTAVAKSIAPPPTTSVVVVPKPDPALKRTELASASFGIVGGSDAFLVKFYKSGELQWMVTMAAIGDDSIRGTATDSDGNVYIVGSFRDGTLTIKDTANNTHTLTIVNSAGTTISTSSHAFIAKFDTLGVLQWKARLISNVGAAAANFWDVIVDSSFNVYTVAWATVAAQYYDKDDVLRLTTAAEAYGIAKYNADGTFGWLWTIPKPYNDYEFPITIDKDNNLIHSWRSLFNSTFALRNRDGSTWRASDLNTSSLYTMKLNPTSGTVTWAAGIYGNGNISLRAITADTSGNIYVAFHDSNNTSAPIRDQGTSTGSVLTFSPSQVSSTDAFVVKYNSAGTPQWYIQIFETTGVTADNEAFTYKALACDSQGNLFVTGTFKSNTINFRNGDGNLSGITLTKGDTSTDCVLAKFNSSGTLLWVVRIGGTGNSDSPGSLAIDRTTDDVFWTGYIDVVGTIIDGLGNNAGTTPYSRFNTIKFKGSDGTVLWKTYNTAAYGTARTSADPYGNLFFGSPSSGNPTIVYTKT